MSNMDSNNDLVEKPIPFWVLWGGPIAIMLSLNLIRPPIEWTTGILAAGFAWMGVSCAINAWGCHRRHCYHASPILLIGAILTLLVGFDYVDLGSGGLMYITWGTFALVMLTFLSEKMFGKYTD